MVFKNRTSVTDPPEKRDREGVAVWMATPFGHSAPGRGGEGQRKDRQQDAESVHRKAPEEVVRVRQVNAAPVARARA